MKKIKLTFKYMLNKVSRIQDEILEDVFWHTTKVYNMLLYDVLNNKEIELAANIDKVSINILSSKIYKRYRQENWHSKYLHSHTMQQVIINVIQNYKSYIKLSKIYEKDKKKLKGKPNTPRYKGKSEYQDIVFTKYAIRVKGNKLMLSLSKEMKTKYKVESLNFLIPSKLKKLICFEQIKEITIQKLKDRYSLNIVYEKQEKIMGKENNNIMSIDLGLDNLVACTNRDNSKTLLVSGRTLKSRNKYYSERIKKLQKIEMKKYKDSKKYTQTKQIKSLYKKRNNYINTYLHKVSRMTVEYAKENSSKMIVIGDIKNIKQKMKKNKNFVQIPIQKLAKLIEYKARLDGIEVEYITEEYTSGVSSLDKEEITKEKYNPRRRVRRVKRGLFITNNKIKMNADINGSLNILRKYIKKSSPNQEIAMDNGREQRPLKRSVA